MLRITSFIEDDRKYVNIEKTYTGYVFYYKNRKVGELVRTVDGFAFIKEVDLKNHNGLGQYYVYHNKVGTSKAVIDVLEEKFKGFELSYVVKFSEGNKLLGYIIYDWYYYKRNRKMHQDADYEVQYQIELPADIMIYVSEAKTSGKKFIITVDYDGKVSYEWT